VLLPIITVNANAIQAYSAFVYPLQTNTDNVINDNSTIIASPINLGFPKGIATAFNLE
jgi:hypothetical protein